MCIRDSSFSAKVFAGISPITFFKKASPAMIFAFTSTSSAATIPLSKECADELGAENDVSSFVIPLGATINMDAVSYPHLDVYKRQGLHLADNAAMFKRAERNPVVLQMMEDYGEERCHELLHVTYNSNQ